MIGSWKLSAKGRTRMSTSRSCRDMAAAAISGPDMIDVLPVALRRQCAQRYRMLEADVLGKKKKSRMSIAPESHINSQIVQRQPSKCAEKPPSSGPRLGADEAKTAQTVIAYACFLGE